MKGNESLLQAVRSSQLVVADNVADYYFSHEGNAPIGASDFPNVMLPFELSFLEFRFPASTEIKKWYEACGILFSMRDGDEWRRMGHTYAEKTLKFLEQPGVVYHLNGHFFLQARGVNTIISAGSFVTPVDREGCIVSPENRVPIIGSMHIREDSGGTKEARDQFAMHMMDAMTLPSLLALSFLHCRNVKMREEIPSPKLSKKHEKKGNKPLVRYHVLKIDHLKAVLEREGKMSTEGLKKALHICRGHFATYGKDGKKLLFGKHAGRFWIPMHMQKSYVCREFTHMREFTIKSLGNSLWSQIISSSSLGNFRDPDSLFFLLKKCTSVSQRPASIQVY